MITANELRLGNIISANIPPHGFVNHVVGCMDIEYMYKGCVLQDNIAPIPLTQEIIEMCGGAKRYAEIEFETASDQPFLIQQDENNGEYFYSAGEGCKLSRGIKYLHELQNMYFAIVGEELHVLKDGETAEDWIKRTEGCTITLAPPETINEDVKYPDT